MDNVRDKWINRMMAVVDNEVHDELTKIAKMYVNAQYPKRTSFGVTSLMEQTILFNRMRALGLLEEIEAGRTWRLTPSGHEWVMQWDQLRLLNGRPL